MKNWFKKAVFSIHIAWRNMRIHPFRTMLLLIGFLGISMTVILAITMSDIFYTYFYGNMTQKYQDIDLKITVDTDSNARFFSTTFLDDQVDDVVNDIYPFFEYEALVSIAEDDRMYAHIYASSTDMLAHLSDDTFNESAELADNEIVVTRSYAKNHDLVIGDALTLEASSQTKDFYIVDILEDGKLFSGESMFMDKQASLYFFLSALEPSLAGLPNSLLRNIYNVLYVDIASNTSYDDVVQAFKQVDGYNTLDYIKTIDDVAINQLIQRNTSLLSGLLAFIFVAIILVLLTTLQYFFLDRELQVTTIRILGGRNRFGLSVLGVELFIEQTIAFLIAVILTNMSVKFGMNYLESAWIYQLTTQKILIASSMILGVFLMIFAYYSYKNRMNADMKHMRNVDQQKAFNVTVYIAIAISSLLIYGLLYIPQISVWLGFNANVIRVVLSVIFLLSIAPVMLVGCMQLFKRFKTRVKTYYHLKIMMGKKGYSHFFSVALIVSIVVFLLVFMMQHLNQRIETIQHEYDFDIIVSRVLNDEENVYAEISSLDTVTSVDRADIYDKVEVKDSNLSIDYLMSMDMDHIDTYFNLEGMEVASELLQQTLVPAIILPRSFKDINGYQEQDNITLTLDNQTYVIAGFFEKQGLGIAFTNLYMIDSEVSEHANSMLVKASGASDILRDQLLDRYSDRMIIVFDFWRLYLEPFISAMIKVKNFIMGYLSVLMACFMMTLANHQTMLQIEREADDARMLSMGYHVGAIQKETLKEGIISLCIIIVASIMAYLLMVGQIAGMIAAFGAYEYIIFKPISIIIGVGINSVIFSIMWVLRIRRQASIQFSGYAKTY